MFSFQPYGINYADLYALAQPRITKFRLVNDYFHRLKNFHQAPRMKFLYHCVRITIKFRDKYH